jgi:hypothetical protein
LGSIAHLQYYFARTGLLDGKGAQFARKKPTGTLDLASLNGGLLSPNLNASDKDSSYSSMRSSPDLMAQGGQGSESPVSSGPVDYMYDSPLSEDEADPDMLPPTVSTYNHREKPVQRPPTLPELKTALKSALEDAEKALAEAKAQMPQPVQTPTIKHLRSPSTLSLGSPNRRRSESDASILFPGSSPTKEGGNEGKDTNSNQGWYELQGMHILDIITFAIRAARQYYTAHTNPVRLSSIKSERKIRAELLGVMEVLRRMATRNFTGGMKDEERTCMEDWVQGCWDMLAKEEEIERQELDERKAWKWLDDSAWPSTADGQPCIERELSFLQSMDLSQEPLPDYQPSNLDLDQPQPSAFLIALQNGIRLNELHNSMVKKSKRPFGSVVTPHEDTAKPYRCAENLRYWIKAAELRWEVFLKVDVMGVVNGVDPAAWRGFEAAIWQWSAKVREELAMDMRPSSSGSSNGV